ncbi:hypothetical protein [Nocardioides stalactiti]|uniref:hypothetical protein n=1 Tax=Nocardioides stalactiti TaxID=2755356 RepID=UPI0016011765|nr:hypothetical protein [Nocardioides stalactiti]
MKVDEVRTVLVVAAVVAALGLSGCGDDSGSDGDESPTATSTLPVVADETWCAGWQELVALQGQWLATPTPDSTAQLLASVDALRGLGVPESLDPTGHTELTAVLDDVRASADPSFTPTVRPSEPADVGLGHDHGDEGEAEDEHGEAPFGTWLVDHCAP